MTGLRMITVAVNYADLLAVTLPRNVKHFDEVHIVTDHDSSEEVGDTLLAMHGPGCDTSVVTIHRTGLFTAGGAQFNKWAALEWGLDRMGRHGWLAIMDADVVWPRSVSCRETDRGHLEFYREFTGGRAHEMTVIKGQLCTPYRRMWDEWPDLPSCIVAGQRTVEIQTTAWDGPDGRRTEFMVPESEWFKFPRHRNVKEWAGYCQIFHASDPALGQPPWHETDWTHCGGADSFFQARWHPANKVRPPWEVLHLGPAGANWYGRATRRADGTVPEGAEEKAAAVRALWLRRQAARAAGRDQFQGERIG